MLPTVGLRLLANVLERRTFIWLIMLLFTQRINELSDFLLAYIRQQLDSPDIDTRDFAQAQKWTALAYTRPSEAAREIASALSRLKLENKAEWVRIASIVETFAEPLAEFNPLLIYARGLATLSRGDLEGATAQLSKVHGQKHKVEVAGVILNIPLEVTELETKLVQKRIIKTLESRVFISPEVLFGVKEYITTLREYLRDKEGSCFISIVGSGGVGKTSVVEKLVREHTVESGFVELAWVTAKRNYFLVENRSIRDVGTVLNIDALISEIAEQLQINLPPNVDEHFSCLQNHLKSKPCLIVIDNLETLQDYTDLITKFNPYSQKNNLRPSKLLFTSSQRIQKLTTQVRELELKGIGANPTLELIRYKGAHVQRINDALDEELLPIFHATNGVPLIILLVVSLIATDDSPLDEIIQSLSRQEELYTYLYEEALVSIKENALKVLTSMTHFSESSPVPGRLLKQETQLNDDDFREAVGECIQRSLLTSISKLSEEPRYSIHNLLYEFLRSELFSDEA